MTVSISFLYTLSMTLAAIISLLAVLNLIVLKNTLSSKKTILFSFFAIGFFYSCICFSWLLAAYPLKSFNVTGATGFIMVGLVFLTTSSGAALSFLSFYPLHTLHQKKYPKKIIFSVFILLVGLLGYIRSLLLWIIYFSPNTSFGMYWLFSSPSLAFALTPLRELYRYAGILGTDMLLGAIIVIFFIYTRNISRKATFFSYTSLLLIIVTLAYFSEKIPNTQKTSEVVTMNDGATVLILKTERMNEQSKNEQLVTELKKHHNLATYSAIFLPEDIGLSSEIKKEINGKVEVFYGDTLFTHPNIINTLLVQNKKGETSSLTSKKFLMPFGEYMPSLFSFVGVSLLKNEDMYRVSRQRDYTSGKGVINLPLGGEDILTGLCSDVWSYEGLATTSKHKNQTLFIPQSNSIFNMNPWFLTNLYAWHNAHAYSSSLRVVSVPNDSPIWVIDARRK